MVSLINSIKFEKVPLIYYWFFSPFLSISQYDSTKGYQYKLSLQTHVSAKEMKKQYILEQRIENIAENNEDENLDYHSF